MRIATIPLNGSRMLCESLEYWCGSGVGVGAGDVRLHHSLLHGGATHGLTPYQDDGAAALGHQALAVSSLPTPD